MRHLVSAALLASVAAATDAPFVPKLGTLAPAGSSWHEILKLPAALRAKLVAIARETGARADVEVPAWTRTRSPS